MPRCHSSAHHGMSILMVVAAALFNELVHAGEIGDVLDWSRWTEVAGLPAPRYNLAVVQFSGAIYALGGEDDATYSDDVFRFDGMNWTQVEDLPYPCSEMAVAVHDGRIYLIGGNTTGSSVLSYDGAAWRTEPGLPELRYGLGAAALNGILYAVGGMERGAQCDVFQFADGVWSEAPALPVSRAHLVAASFQGALYALGGADNRHSHRSAYRFDGSEWTKAADFLAERQDLAAAALGSNLYVIGGSPVRSASYVGSDSVYCYDGTAWTEASRLPAPRMCWGAAELNGALYAVGGIHVYTPRTNVYRYPAVAMRAVEPPEGVHEGGFTVTINGRGLCGLWPVSRVTLCGAPADAIVSWSATQVVVRAGPALGIGALGDVVVEAGNQISVATNGFRYQPPSSLIVMTPDGVRIPIDVPARKENGTLFDLSNPEGVPISNRFILANGSTQTIHILSVATNGPDAACFWVEGLPDSLAAGGTQAFAIAYRADSWTLRQTAALVISNSGATSCHVIRLEGGSYEMIPDQGQRTGGYPMELRSAAALGNGSDITRVVLDAQSVPIVAQGTNWVQVTAPVFARTGMVQVAVASGTRGWTLFTNAFQVHPAGAIADWLDYSQWGLMTSPPLPKVDFVLVERMNQLVATAPVKMAQRDYPLQRRIYNFDADFQRWDWIASDKHCAMGAGVASYRNRIYCVGGIMPLCAGIYRPEMTIVYPGGYGGAPGPWIFLSDGNRSVLFRDQLYHFQHMHGMRDNGWVKAGLPYRLWELEKWRRAPALGEANVEMRETGKKVPPVYGGWGDVPAAPGSDRYNFALTVYRDAIHMLGGQNEEGEFFDTACAFDGTNWTVIASLPEPCANLGAAVCGGYLYAIGGEDAMGSRSQVFRYDGTNWTSFVSLPSNRHWQVAASVDGVLYAGGGRMERDAQSAVCRYPAMIQNAVSPTFGPVPGGYLVTISGADLGDGNDITNVTLCGVNVAALVSQTASQVVVIAGQGAGGRGPVAVYSRSRGETVKADAFTYEGPLLRVHSAKGMLISHDSPPTQENGSLYRLQPGQSVRWAFNLANASRMHTVVITNWTITGAHAGQLSVQGLPVVLEPGRTKNLNLEYASTTSEHAHLAFQLHHNGVPNPYVVNLDMVVSSNPLDCTAGPVAGGGTLTIRDGALGNGSDITNVTFGGVRAVVVTQGVDFVTVIAPPSTGAGGGPVSVEVQSASRGVATYYNAYAYRPFGRIGRTWRQEWMPLNSGLDNEVCALAEDGSGHLMAAGHFTYAGDVECNGVARWDGLAWHALERGLNDTVKVLAIGTNMIYAGGLFTTSSAIGASHVARWDGTMWLPLRGGVNGPVFALAYTNGLLFVAGQFTRADGVAVTNIAMWDESSQSWSALSENVDCSMITALALDPSGNLFAAGPLLTGYSFIAALPTPGHEWFWRDEWAFLGFVQTLMFAPDSVMHAGGDFRAAGGNSQAQFLTRRVNNAWHAFPALMVAPVRSLAFDDSNRLYVATENYKSGGNPVYLDDGSTWSAVNARLGNAVNALHVHRSSSTVSTGLYAAGRFIYRGGAHAAYNIALAGGSFTDPGVEPSSCALTGGVSVVISGGNLCNGTSQDVTRVTLCGVLAPVTAVHGSTQIVVTAGAVTAPITGDVIVVSTEYGGAIASNAFAYGPVARRAPPVALSSSAPRGSYSRQLFPRLATTDSGWTNLALGVDGEVLAALRLPDGSLVVGGDFHFAGTNPASGIAIWNGSDWTNLGAGVDGAVYALASDTNGLLYAGGVFTSAGDVPSANIARWNGTAWTNLAGGVDDAVYALLFTNEVLFAGGAFTSADGYEAQRLAVWNGEFWLSLSGDPLDEEVHALAFHADGLLYAGGAFAAAGEVALNHVGCWNGDAWTNLGAGFDGLVYDLAFDANGTLHAAGAFTASLTNETPGVARWTGCDWQPVGAGLRGEVCALAFDAGNRLFAGGDFWASGETPMRRIAQWNGTVWTNCGAGLNNCAHALECDAQGHVVAGGRFTCAGAISAAGVACWSSPAPMITSVTPASGVRTGGYAVVLAGKFPDDGADITLVALCGVEASITSRSATQLVVTAGASISGSLGAAKVVSPLYGTGTRPDGFRYLGPRIEVVGLMEEPVSSGDPAFSANGTAFPPLTVGNVYTQHFGVVNCGADVLHVSSITLSGPGASSFRLLPSSFTLPPDATTNFALAFAPTNDGSFRASVLIANDDTNFIMNIAGVTYRIEPSTAAYTGGATIILTCGASFNPSNDLTGVYVAGLYTTNITAQGVNWVAFIMPSVQSLGPVDITPVSEMFGATYFSDALAVSGPDCSLRVLSPYGDPEPPSGEHAHPLFTSLDCSVSSPIQRAGRTLTCLGWTLAGNEPAAGTGSSFTMLVTNHAVLTWIWKSEPPQSDFYADTASADPVAPYDSWATAARTIQDAVDAAGDDTMVWVADGLYNTGGRPAQGMTQTNRVTIEKSIMISSTSDIGGVRIAGMADAGGGDGLGPAAVRGLYADAFAWIGGCVFQDGHAGAFSGGEFSGGGALASSNAALHLYGCRFEACAAYNGGGVAGGVLWNSVIQDCTAQNQGGGVHQAELYNCLLVGNAALSGGGACSSDLHNCTLVANAALVAGGGLYQGRLLNGISYYNSAPSCSNYSGTVAYSCTTPLADGLGNRAEAPGFVDAASRDYRLLSHSICINNGWNEDDWMNEALDLAGSNRIQNSAVDMGAYESAFWGMYADVDEDQFTDWIEVQVAGTDPTNATSFLGMASSVANGAPSGVVVRWQSVAGRLYHVDRATNLVAEPVFSNMAGGVLGLPGFTTVTDTTATATGPYFYRVGIGP